MPFNCMFQEESGMICLKACGSNLRSLCVVDHRRSMETTDDYKQSCWAKMPPDLLTDILTRIEESESNWPSRKYVVSCAGVCRSWRKIMQEIVKRPQLSGKLTFPVSLKQPGSVGSLTQCLIERDPRNQIYYLYLHNGKAVYPRGKFLLAAKRVRCATCTEYIISLHYNDFRGSCIGKLRSNFLGTKFKVYDADPPNTATNCRSSILGSMKRLSPKVPAGSYLVSSISYKVNALRTRGPRQMWCEINTIHEESSSLPPVFRLLDNSQLMSLTGQKNVKLVLKNKMLTSHPRWDWYLDFNGRLNYASVKNFQLACLNNEAGVKEHENIFLQFGKVDSNYYIMDYRCPISAIQAFAICLSSFDTKVAGDRGWMLRHGDLVHFHKVRP